MQFSTCRDIKIETELPFFKKNKTKQKKTYSYKWMITIHLWSFPPNIPVTLVLVLGSWTKKCPQTVLPWLRISTSIFLAETESKHNSTTHPHVAWSRKYVYPLWRVQWWELWLINQMEDQSNSSELWLGDITCKVYDIIVYFSTNVVHGFNNNFK